MYICRYTIDKNSIRIGFVDNQQVYDITARFPSITAFLRWTIGRTDAGSALKKALHGTPPTAPLSSVTLLRPTDDQEIWAAGVTYERSRVAREEESANSGIYDRVYRAARPEVFFKATPSRVVGPMEPVAIRHDASWNVPEPELALVINPAKELIGYTVGNDMSSRDIEGENPLYLPQAKCFKLCAAVGPCLLITKELLSPDTKIAVTITRAGATVFSGETPISQLKRSVQELADFLYRDNTFPTGALLMTGTGIVPGDDFTLQSGDEIAIAIEGIGTLVNPMG